MEGLHLHTFDDRNRGISDISVPDCFTIDLVNIDSGLIGINIQEREANIAKYSWLALQMSWLILL